jgi:hypothetical protein
MSRLPRAELLLRWNPKVRIRVTASIAEVGNDNEFLILHSFQTAVSCLNLRDLRQWRFTDF